MKYRSLSLASVLAGLSLSMSISVQAETGMNAGISLSYMKYDNLTEFYTPAFSDAYKMDVDDTSEGINVYFGVRLPLNFGVELGYSDLGNFKAIESIYTPLASLEEKRYDYDLRGLTLAGRYDLNFGQYFGLYGKLGFMKLTAEYEQTNTVTDLFNNTITSSSASQKYDDEVPFAVLGAKFNTSEKSSVFFEVSYANPEISTMAESQDIELLGVYLGVNYNFGAEFGSSTTGVHQQDGRKRAITACDPQFKDVAGGTACE